MACTTNCNKCLHCGVEQKNCKCNLSKEAAVHAQAKDQHYDTAKDKSGHAKEHAKEAGRGMMDAAKDVYQGVKEGVKETAKDVKMKAADMKEAAKEKYHEMQGNVNTDDSPNPKYDVGAQRNAAVHHPGGPHAAYDARQYAGDRLHQAGDALKGH